MKIFAFFVALALGWLIGGWVLMLFIGALHREWWEFIPTISYRGALLVEGVLFLGFVAGGAAKGLFEVVFGD